MIFARCLPGILTALILGFSPPAGLSQGSLTPPGPPGPTMKTLSQIEPRTPISSLPFQIQSGGSYYLTTNLTGSAGTFGIMIAASDVALDLGGFTMSGLTNSGHGITIPAGLSNVLVRNGTIKGWADGVDARAAINCRYESLRLVENRLAGLAAGMASTVAGCSAYSNRGVGISAEQSSTITDSSAHSNLLQGIRAETASRVVECTSSFNSAEGLVVGDSAVVSGCVANKNLGSGIVGGADVQVSDSKASGNGIHGISAGLNAVIRESTAASNRDSGIATAAGGQVVECNATGNTKGIVVQSGSIVRQCAALQNSGDGIWVSSECLVTGNHSAGNFLARDAAGIRATAAGNSIKENTVISNDWGIRLDAPRNLVIKNTASNNSLNYSVGATPQSIGPIISSDAFSDHSNPLANLEF